MLGEGALEVDVEEGKSTAAAEVVLFNPGKAPLDATLQLESATASDARISPARVDVPARDVTRAPITFTRVADLNESAAGTLVVRAGERVVVRDVVLTPRPDNRWFGAILVAAGGAMLLVGLGVVVCARRKKKGGYLTKKAPGPKWGFKSWATTATAVGAVLGIVLSGITFPDVPGVIEKESVTALNLIFAGLVVVAPLVFQSIRKPGAPVDPDDGFWGYNWALLLACAITAGAVVGQLATLALLGWELTDGGAWGAVIGVALCAVALLALYYFLVTSFDLATTDWETMTSNKKEADEERAEAVAAVANLGVTGSGNAIVLAPEPSPSRASWDLL